MPVSLGGPAAVNGVVFSRGTVLETKLRAFAPAAMARWMAASWAAR